MLFGLSKIFMLSFKNKIVTSYKIVTLTIPCIDSHKDLMIIVSSDLSWDTHYKQIISNHIKYLVYWEEHFPCKTTLKLRPNYIISEISLFLLLYNLETPPKKHIQWLEHVQRRATKYILKDFSSDYKSRLIKLYLIPLMYILDINDVMFLIKSLENPHEGFSVKLII